MGLETPKLDDRSFTDLVEEARRRIPLYCPEWTDHNLSDPGITLIELFAWMTDIVLYRLNRVPDKHYIKFMELLGMRLQQAEPARVPVTFWLSTPQPTTIVIPDGTQVATMRTEIEPAIVFSTDGPMEIYVPNLTHVMTSGGGQAEGRSFHSFDVNSLASGMTEVSVFESTPPKTGDAIYFGFEQNLSNHIIGIDMVVDIAEGAGIDPTNPPYIWEVLGSEINQNWSRVEVDYDGTLGLNVAGLVRLHLPKMRRALRNDVTAYWIRCRLDPAEGTRSYGVSPQIKKLIVESWGATVDTTNVTTIRNEVMGRSDGSPGQRFYLEHIPVVTRTPGEYLLVRLEDGRDERWTEVSDFSTSQSDDRHYTLDSATGEIRFGPALPQRDGQIHRYGGIPPKSAMLVMRSYRSGGGQIGNVAARTLNVIKTALPYVDRVTNRFAAQGGLDAENLDNAKMRVPGYLRALNRAVTASDFEYLTHEAAPNMVGRVSCLQPPQTSRGEIKVLVIPHIPRLQGFISPESLNLPNELRDTITSYLDERRLLATQLSVIPPAYQWVETEVRFRPSRHYDSERVRLAVEDSLFTFLNPLTGGQNGEGWPFGRDLFLADVMAALLSVPGVDFLRSVKLFPVTYSKGQFTRGEEMSEIPVVTHGVIVSYRHDVRVE
jgi:predicted phage baseplate assembly protein